MAEVEAEAEEQQEELEARADELEERLLAVREVRAEADRARAERILSRVARRQTTFFAGAMCRAWAHPQPRLLFDVSLTLHATMAQWLAGLSTQVCTALCDWLMQHRVQSDVHGVQAWAGGGGAHTDATVRVTVARFVGDVARSALEKLTRQTLSGKILLAGVQVAQAAIVLGAADRKSMSKGDREARLEESLNSECSRVEELQRHVARLEGELNDAQETRGRSGFSSVRSGQSTDRSQSGEERQLAALKAAFARRIQALEHELAEARAEVKAQVGSQLVVQARYAWRILVRYVAKDEIGSARYVFDKLREGSKHAKLQLLRERVRLGGVTIGR